MREWFRPLLVSLALASDAVLGGQNWPQFRGPEGNGHSDADSVPLTWSEQQNVRWKTLVHDRGWSSPVIWGAQIWVTTADPRGTRLYAVCVDRDSGQILHDLRVFDVETPQAIDPANSYASPTPVIEPGRVYVTFGSPGTACLDTGSGQVLWQRRDLACRHPRGPGSSPILHGELLIMNFDGADHQYVVALDKMTGKTVWRTPRSADFGDVGWDRKPMLQGDLRKAFSTPHVADISGRAVVISIGARAAYGYAAATGVELWRVDLLDNHSACTRPVVGLGLVFLPTGINQPKLLAVTLESSLSRPETIWMANRNVPHKPSPLLVGDLLFMIDDGGVASCLEARSGKERWRERVGGNYSASPVEANGRVYFFSEEGKTTVVSAERGYKVLAENQLEQGCMATPAIAGRALFLRTKTSLYRIEG